MGEYEAKRRFLAHIWLGLYHRAKITSVKLVVATDYRLYFVVLKKMHCINKSCFELFRNIVAPQNGETAIFNLINELQSGNFFFAC